MFGNRRGTTLLELMVVLSLLVVVLASLGASVHAHLALARAHREQVELELRLVRLAEQFRESVHSASRFAVLPNNGGPAPRLVLENPDGASIRYEFHEAPARLVISGAGPAAAREVFLLPKGSRAWFEPVQLDARPAIAIVVQRPRGRERSGALAETRIQALLGAARRRGAEGGS